MPKIHASLADISTSFEPFDPGVYIMAIRKITETSKDGRVSYQFALEVTGSIDGNENAIGRKFSHFISIHKQDGELNPYGLADIKRFFEAISPDSANSDEADTDELIDGEFMAQVIIDEYQKKDSEGNPIGKPNRNNKLDTRSIQAAS